jgi:HlyD family secretion protein
MDIPRQHARRHKIIRRIAIGFAILVPVAGLSYYVMKLKPAAPSEDRGAVWMDSVKRGNMLIEVRGQGSLVPEEILHIPAPYGGRVERIHVLPGIIVTEDTVLVDLRNTDMEQQEMDARLNVQQAESDLANTKAQLESQRLNQKADLAGLEANFKRAKDKNDHDEILFKQGLMLELDYKLSKSQADEAATRFGIEQERGKSLADSLAAQMAAKETSVTQLKAMLQLRRDQLVALKVRAGVAGTLQQVLVQAGQQLGAGTDLAIVVQPRKLKAELKVPETQAKDVQIGQTASVDTRNGLIAGKVSRIDPSVRDGSVVVDVRLEGALPQGARPDLSVDGTIQIEKLDNVVYVGKPTNAAENGATELFRLNPDGKEAVRVKVKLGRSSVNVIEVLEGLQVGDQVILSDMAKYDGYDRVRLN